MEAPQNWGGKNYGEHVWTGKLPPALHGAQVLVTIVLKHGAAVSEHDWAIVLPANGDPFGGDATVTMRTVSFSPPLPPETDQERRRRLIAGVLNRARESGQLGLTTDNQSNTVRALMDALDGEFVDEDMTDLNPSDHDPRDYRDGHGDED
jgi:hypothetical protein